ncbi:hypothetical protein JSY14_04630 [Brachybacterium sp. EF45031]|uniref:hypothetical protein n=1 Tax=Brachybacterium sillae TaxID=2810536 RepID=UPI00217D0567|nr:hypothetical protein [Brachybacterium sillae]MCS6711336.1 hypothetical protein [Brachybacterium sillae]
MGDWQVYAKAAGRTARKQAAAGAAHARRDAAAYAVVADRHARRARLGVRLRDAVRDTLLIGVSLLILWFVITRTGARIPVTWVLAAMLVLVVVRIGYALMGRR